MRTEVTRTGAARMIPPTPTPTQQDDQLTYTYDDRHWRMRRLDKQLSCERLRVNLLVSRRELVHVDTLDLYAARAHRAFLQEAAAELCVEEATLKQDLGRRAKLAAVNCGRMSVGQAACTLHGRPPEAR